MAHLDTSLLATVLEVAGLILLAREVYLGHIVESLFHGMEWAKQMLFLYTKRDYEGCYILNRLDQGDTPERARQWVDDLGPAAVKKAVEDAWTGIGAKAAASITRWEERTTPEVMRRRRWALWIGTIMLIAGAIVHYFHAQAA